MFVSPIRKSKKELISYNCRQNIPVESYQILSEDFCELSKPINRAVLKTKGNFLIHPGVKFKLLMRNPDFRNRVPHIPRSIQLAALLFLLVLLPACQPDQPLPAPAPEISAPVLPTPTTANNATFTTEPTRTPVLASPTPTTAPLKVCSPLAGYGLDQLESMIVNPFHPPAPGLDTPHQGVDLAIRAANSGIALSGAPVEAALSGQVVMILHDRFPYGNAVLIETPLDPALSYPWPASVLPTPGPTLAPRSALTCPTDVAPPAFEPTQPQRSLYLLYAHLQDLADLQPGQAIHCGDPIGKVGSSGNALNPHLHLEMRVGPQNAPWDGMAHYDASASPAEMSAYCLWRVSGWFQLVDPLQVLLSTSQGGMK